MKTILPWVILLTLSTGLQGQSIDRSTIATAGDYFTKPGIQLSWTLGQPSLVETFTKPSVVLMQGFQQADIQTDIIMPPVTLFDIQLYPNPAPGEFHLSLASPVEGSIYIQLFDISGKLIMQHAGYRTEGGRWNLRVVTPGVAPGVYHCRVLFNGDDHQLQIRNIKLTLL